MLDLASFSDDMLGLYWSIVELWDDGPFRSFEMARIIEEAVHRRRLVSSGSTFIVPVDDASRGKRDRPVPVVSAIPAWWPAFLKRLFSRQYRVIYRWGRGGD